jgi:hypothetical protein
MQQEKYNKKQQNNKRKTFTALESGTLLNPDAAGIDVHPTAIFIAVPPGRDVNLGPMGAITALAHKLARIVWHLVTFKTPYDETIFLKSAQKHQKRQEKFLIKRVESMGYRVLTAPVVPAQVP